ncbi:rhodanese-like domain-containing protein [Clostridium perfringens]|nr:rhodanese-like domain-containing protein [Clostridium perfringens]
MFSFLKRNSRESINVNDLDSMLGKVNLIDIREPYEYKARALKNSKNIPMIDILGNPSKYLDKDKKYYIMCQSGGRSSRVTGVLSKEGYDVINVSGGIGSYVGTKLK